MQTFENIRILKDDEVTTTEHEAFAYELLTGLSTTPKSLPSKYFYDDEGSRLFQKITQLEEYYPTRAELEIFQHHSSDILNQTGFKKMNLIELGAGDGHKTFVLLQELLDQKIDFTYYPIDISAGAMEALMVAMKEKLGDIKSEGIISDYFKGLQWINNQQNASNLVLFLGSNVGNFSAMQTHAFLIRLWQVLNPGDMVLIGFDLKKDVTRMTQAYSDSKGVTRDFNLNLLKRINHEFDANFNLDKYIHHAFYNPVKGAMESYIISTVEQIVEIGRLNRTISFYEYEPIHTEYSYKYTFYDINGLAKNAGFIIEENFLDKNRYFVDSLWRVLK